MVTIMKRLQTIFFYCLGASAVILAGIVLFLPADSTSRETPHDEVCRMWLGYLGGAIERYRHDKSHLPCDIKGSAGLMESWRLQVMPYHHLWELLDYRPEEPWDSPHNRKEAEQRGPFMYQCRVKWSSAERPFTSYLMLIRPDREGPNGAMSLPADAVLVVESVGCEIGCFEPRDLQWDDLWRGDSPFGVGKLNSRHPNYVRALRVDGEVIEIPKDIDSESLRKLLNGSISPD